MPVSRQRHHEMCDNEPIPTGRSLSSAGGFIESPDFDYSALVDGAHRCRPEGMKGTSGLIDVLEAVFDPANRPRQ